MLSQGKHRYSGRFVRTPSLILATTRNILANESVFLGNACDPQNYEPNLALNLEVADLVNSKKGNA